MPSLPHAELLRSVATRLSRRPGRLEIARAIAEITPAALEARTALVLLPDDHGRPMVVATAGHSAEGEAVAAIAWGFAHERDFDADFLALARELAGYCGVALARGALFDARQRRAEQILALERAVTAMAVAADVEGVVDAVARHGPAVTGAGGVAVLLAAPDGRLAVHAAEEAAHRRVATFLDATDADVDAWAGAGEPVTLAGDAPGQTWVMVPFARPAQVPGALLLRYAQPPVADEVEVALRATLAQSLGQAVARARLAAGARRG